MMKLVDEYSDKFFELKEYHILELNRLAVECLVENPGAYRQVPIEITKAKHEPPDYQEVPKLVGEMCDYVNKGWDKGAIHLAAYLLWRLNWIHPFEDGNGRTARAVSYIILCIHSRKRLPGKKAIPDRISEDKQPYYEALEASDEASNEGGVSIDAVEDYLQGLLVEQITDATADSSSSQQPLKSTRITSNNGKKKRAAISSINLSSDERETRIWGMRAVHFFGLSSAIIIAVGAIIAAIITKC